MAMEQPIRPQHFRPGGETILLDLPLESKFSISSTSQGGLATPLSPPPTAPKDSPRVKPLVLNGGAKEHSPDVDDDIKTPTRPAHLNRAATEETSTATAPNPLPVHPPIPRALSMPLPLPSQLQNPHSRQSQSQQKGNSGEQLSAELEFSQLHELALELADSVQMVIQTMLQISPPQVLDTAKEQVSAFALSIPTPSMSAMFTVMKNINYISANISTFCSTLQDGQENGNGNEAGRAPEPGAAICGTGLSSDFDIGELLQSSGDALGGAAAAAGVELVLYHGDVDLKHIWVNGDESALSYALLHIVRQVLRTTRPGDSLEIGLYASAARDDDEGSEAEDTVQLSFEMVHNFPASTSDSGDPSTLRPQPAYSIPLLPRLLSKFGGKLTTKATPSEGVFTSRRAMELSFALPKGHAPPRPAPRSPDEKVAGEPSIEQLKRFAEELRGKKGTLYASVRGAFAHHLTSYLTAWGMEVDHEGEPDNTERPQATKGSENGESTADPAKAEVRSAPIPKASFIFIDDDVEVLNERFQSLRKDPLPTHRPPLLHRALSASQVARTGPMTLPDPAPTTNIIVHFTSLANFKNVKNAVHSILTTQIGIFPEIMIIPKPAGPRRLLTALHTAVTRPVVDAFFSPIVTSPGVSTPSASSSPPFFSSAAAVNTPISVPLVHRPSGSRTSSDRSLPPIQDVLDTARLPPPSPLGISETGEYFTQTPVQLEKAKQLGLTPSSGLVVESTEGQPHGLYFCVDRTKGGVTGRAGTRPATPPVGEERATSPPIPKRRMKRRTSVSSSNPDSPVPETKDLKKNAIFVPPISVLIVEDNPINQTILSTFMKRKKIKYDVANDGKTAVEKWKTGGFHLILMDIQMPIMDGMEATAIIRKMESEMEQSGYAPRTPGSIYNRGTPPLSANDSRSFASPHRSHVIILALTASSWHKDRVAALAAGCDDFLTKPVSMNWLNNKILEWGSMQALRMWGAPDPVTDPLQNNQAVRAQSVAGALQIPKGRSHTPSPVRGVKLNRATVPASTPLSTATSSSDVAVEGPSTPVRGKASFEREDPETPRGPNQSLSNGKALGELVRA